MVLRTKSLIPLYCINQLLRVMGNEYASSDENIHWFMSQNYFAYNFYI
jgi:hypothetical protein